MLATITTCISVRNVNWSKIAVESYKLYCRYFQIISIICISAEKITFFIYERDADVALNRERKIRGFTIKTIKRIIFLKLIVLDVSSAILYVTIKLSHSFFYREIKKRACKIVSSKFDDAVSLFFSLARSLRHSRSIKRGVRFDNNPAHNLTWKVNNSRTMSRFPPIVVALSRGQNSSVQLNGPGLIIESRNVRAIRSLPWTRA